MNEILDGRTINVFDFLKFLRIIFSETKGIWLRDRKKVRKSVDMRIVACQIRRYNIAAHSVPFIISIPRVVGGLSVIQQALSKGRRGHSDL